MNLDAIQLALREAHLDGWLFYDHHHRDPLAYGILGLDAHSFVSRRWYYFIPAHGEPQKLVHRIESAQARRASRRQARLLLLAGARTQSCGPCFSGATKLAMQYSPRNAIMYVSMVDAGTVELLRAMGKDIVSSADLVSTFEAVLTDDQIATHYVAQEKVDKVLAAGMEAHRRSCPFFGAASTSTASSSSSKEAFATRRPLHRPRPQLLRRPQLRRLALRAHASIIAPHPHPATSSSSTSGPNWRTRQPFRAHPTAIWYDITWTAVVDREPTDREQSHLQHRPRRPRRLHRHHRKPPTPPTSPSPAGRPTTPPATSSAPPASENSSPTAPATTSPLELHGNGAHLDNLETHDERLILPNTCFSVEPGLYFPGEFGIRNEVNMITKPGKASVTGPMQNALLRI